MFCNVARVEKWIFDAITPSQSTVPVGRPNATQGKGNQTEIIEKPSQ
jgi:hypothetical protein